MRTKNKIASRIWMIIFIIFVIVWLFPVIFALGTSFRPLQDVYNNVLNIIPTNPTLENYATLFQRLPMGQIILNTFIIATSVTLLKLAVSFLSAYAFVYYRFKGQNVVYFILIASIFIPFTVTMIPNYLLISRLGINDNILGVILPQVADAAGILLLNQAMRTIPISLIEVAKLDNVGDWRIMKDLVIPMIKPQITSSGIWFFVNSWNEFVWPSIILKSTENYTLPLALQMFISSEGGTNFSVAMAVSVVTMSIPLLLYIIFQKHIIGTFTSSGIK